MKKIVLLVISITLLSCENTTEREQFHKKKFSILMSNDKGWSGSELECDSFNMISKTQVNVWIDSSKSTVYSNELRVVTNKK
jgi:hypothetical protein